MRKLCFSSPFLIRVPSSVFSSCTKPTTQLHHRCSSNNITSQMLLRRAALHNAPTSAHERQQRRITPRATTTMATKHHSTTSTSKKRVAVIGAGAAGLAAARELLREGHTPRIFEQARSAGGVWVYSDAVDADLLGSADPNARAHSSMYIGLRTNLPREIMSFTQFPFTPQAMAAAGQPSSDPRRFPSHAEVLAYLRAYAAHHGLEQHLQFGARVLRAEPIADDHHSAHSGGGGGGGGNADDVGDADAPVTGADGPRWMLTVEVEDPAGSGGRRQEQEVRGGGWGCREAEAWGTRKVGDVAVQCCAANTPQHNTTQHNTTQHHTTHHAGV